ncbi:MAG TPA: FkbM family methyltransferase [Candidatus Acidoferrales bacterium]
MTSKLETFLTSNARTQKLVRAGEIAQLHGLIGAILSSPRHADERRLLKSGYRVYSQADEDGILHEIFKRIGEGNRTFMELGVGNGLENNTLFLLVQGWSGIWLEGSEKKVAAAKSNLATMIAAGRLEIHRQFVTASTIDKKIAGLTAGRDVDLLSIDLDGNDYYILETIGSISPRVIVAEYNSKFPADVPWIIEYNEAHRWDSTDYFGASLKSLETLLASKGYALVGCNLLGTNAFFVRRDLATESRFCAPFTSENHYEPSRYFLLPAFHAGYPVHFGPLRTK